MNKSDDETKVSQLVRLNQDNEALWGELYKLWVIYQVADAV